MQTHGNHRSEPPGASQCRPTAGRRARAPLHPPSPRRRRASSEHDPGKELVGMIRRADHGHDGPGEDHREDHPTTRTERPMIRADREDERNGDEHDHARREQGGCSTRAGARRGSSARRRAIGRSRPGRPARSGFSPDCPFGCHQSLREISVRQVRSVTLSWSRPRSERSRRRRTRPDRRACARCDRPRPRRRRRGSP